MEKRFIKMVVMRTTIALRPILYLIMVILMNLHTMAQEEAVAFDNNKKIYKLTPELGKKLEVFSGEGTFVDAELFKQNDSTYFIEVRYSKSDKIFRTRKKLNLTDLQTLRDKADRTTIETVSVGESASEGRNFLLTACLVSGLTTYGFALPEILNVNDTRTYLGLYMLGAGAAFVPYFLTKNKPLSYGQANLVYYGVSRGFAHGALFDNAIKDSASAQDVFLFGSLFGISESLLGYKLVKTLQIDNGTANLMTVYGDFGFYTGIALANQFGLVNDANSHVISALIMLGSMGGLVTGYCLGKDKDISAGDAEIISTTGWLGVYLPLSLLVETKPKDDWLYTTPSLLTGIAGLYIGHKLVSDHNFTFTQGYTTKLGTIAGGLVGLGLTYILSKNSSPSQMLLGSYLGAQASFIVLHKINIKALKMEALNKIRFEFTPENLLFAKYLKLKNTQIFNMLPIATLSYKF